MKKTALVLTILLLVCVVNVEAGLSATADKSKIYSTTISFGGSDTITVWMGYVNVTVTSGGAPYADAYVRAVSKGENISSVENTGSNGVALIPILTDSPPPFIDVFVCDISGDCINPEVLPIIVDPSVSPPPSPPAAAAAGGAPQEVITPPPTPVITPPPTPVPTAAHTSPAPALAPPASGTVAEESPAVLPASVTPKKYVSTIKILNLTKEEWSIAGMVVAVEMLTVAAILGRKKK